MTTEAAPVTQAPSPELTRRQKIEEIGRCGENPAYFTWNYYTAEDKQTGRYVPFRLWPDQIKVLKALQTRQYVVLLKARQLGMTTLVLAYAIWLTNFHPNQTVLLFSKTEKEAKELIRRVRNAIYRLPRWLRPKELLKDDSRELEFSNGSKFSVVPRTCASNGPAS